MLPHAVGTERSLDLPASARAEPSSSFELEPPPGGGLGVPSNLLEPPLGGGSGERNKRAPAPAAANGRCGPQGDPR
jgi:hypothetical protein